MTKIDVVAPAKGKVDISLDWDTASALARVLGKVNFKCSKETGLQDIYEALAEHFGDDTKAQGKWKSAKIRQNGFSQIYIEEN